MAKRAREQVVLEAIEEAPVDVGVELPALDTGCVPLLRIDLRLSARQGRALRMIYDGAAVRGDMVRLSRERLAPMRGVGDALRLVLDRAADAFALPLSPGAGTAP